MRPRSRVSVEGADNPSFMPDIKLQDLKPADSEKCDDSENNKLGQKYNIDDHYQPLEEIFARYISNKYRGLNDSQILENREKYGKNVLTPPDKPSHVYKFFKCVVGGLNALLWACAFLSLSCYGSQYLYTSDISNDNLVLGCALIVVVHFSGVFEFYQEFKSDRVMESFKNMVPRTAYVVRNNQRIELEVSDLVVGDIVEIKYGDMVPADVRIVECQNFKVDNSSLTGESVPKRRSINCTSYNPMESKNMAFFSTCAVEGVAKGIVVRVGANTFMGQLANLASSVDSAKSPIRIEMDRFIAIMTIRSLLFGGVFFAVALGMKYSWVESIFFVVGIIVANVPEGLCVTFTMILTLTAKRMAKKHCLVKHLHAVEALGSTSVICTDKTGTLTQNKMSVAHMWFNNSIAEADTSEFKSGARFNGTDPGFAALAKVAILCSRANFKPGQENVEVLKRIVEGDASEAAILKCMELQYRDVVDYRSKFPKLLEIPYNSKNKFQVSIHSLRDPNDSRHFLVMKGAPEKIISYCSQILIGDLEYDLDERWQARFNEIYHTLGGFGERILGFCDCRLPLENYPVDYNFDPENMDFLKEGLRFVGLISLIDPPRAAVPDAISKCRAAGIKIVMVTGDHPITAKAIARSVGIISKERETIEEIAIRSNRSLDSINTFDAEAAVITGAELALLTPTQLENVLTNYQEIVFARTSPEQKYKIVEAFQNLGKIVALTGDGVNDSPALKKADIGIAMGLTGTEVSKEAADMILMDDNFATIVVGVEEGRLIFDNLKKLIVYNLGDNIAEMYSVWFFIILRIPLPMGTIAMLLSVLGTDVLPAISIAHEKAESDIMKLNPRNPKLKKLVTPQLLSYSYGQLAWIECMAGFFTWFVCYGYYGWLPDRVVGIITSWSNSEINDLQDSYHQEWTYAARKKLELTGQTAFFIGIVITQIGNVLNNKVRRKSIFQQKINWRMNIAILFEIGLLSLFIYTPGLNSSLNLHSVPAIIWLAPIPWAILLVIYDEFRRWTVRSTNEGGFVHDEFYT